ncbi:uncharacterized protein LOC127282032 [Leptopilina boulardi]|uniref:uncharacterized protein LOC127282032 n=1 Tax=Leptopilina boulardi TaxID=63433 RepID=UPI0021F5E348|nr:uncharacterized protein LOC127282032 [Leptopilina boulardi]
MAYVLWRVFMRKYSKVRMGIRNLPVIPVDRRASEKDETWTLAKECEDDTSAPDTKENSKIDHEQTDKPNETDGISRGHETRKSKARRVKSYLKKCKGALSKSEDNSVERKRENCSSWYLKESSDSSSKPELVTTDDDLEETISSVPHEVSSSKINKHDIHDSKNSKKEQFDDDDDDESKNDFDKGSRGSLYVDASDIGVHEEARKEKTTKDPDNLVEGPPTEKKETEIQDDNIMSKCDSSDTLIADVPEVTTTTNNFEEVDDVDILVFNKNHQDTSEELTNGINIGTRGDAASLVRTFLGPIYGEDVLDLLTRQARDILVCAYHGNLENFVKSYLSPAANLLEEVKRIATERGNESVVPKGWPLTLNGSGLVLRLGEVEASSLRLGECYLCIRSAAAVATAKTPSATTAADAENVEENTVEIALVWRASSMRAPGFLGWDREDEFMDWRDTSHKVSTSSSTVVHHQHHHSNNNNNNNNSSSSNHQTSSSSSKWRPRRRSREETRTRTWETSADNHHESSRSSERLECSRLSLENNHELTAVVKSKSSSSVDTWKDDIRNNDCRRSTSSSRCIVTKKSSLPGEFVNSIETRSRVRRNAKVVSSSTMEKWKETSRCETRCRILQANDLKTPSYLESVLCKESSRLNQDSASERLENLHPDQIADDELPAYIQSLLVTVERKIERVSLDDLTFPCTACRNIDTDDPLLGCRCGNESCDCGNENCECNSEKEEARTFEVAGIKHIDSDDEEEVRMGFGTKKKIEDVSPPRTIHDILEHVLNCGLTLPGYSDSTGRPVLEFDSNVKRTETLSAREVASFLLYLTRLPSSDQTKDGFTILLLGKLNENVELLDRALFLVQAKIKVPQVLLLQPMEGAINPFPRSQIKTIVLDQSTLDKYIPRRETNYSHAQWVAFYKEYDSLMTEWQAAGRRLALEMSELKECTNLSGSLTSLSRLLADPTSRRTARDADETMTSLEERAVPLSHVDNVRLSLERAQRILEEVGTVASRLESSFESRRATIRNLAVLRSIEDQAREILSWLCKKGEDILSKHAQHAASTLTTARDHEREFEKFYFTSMRHLDKGSDLAEAASASGLRELARSLKHHLRGFGSRLEDRREYLEDTSRCCLLQDRAYEWAQEAKLAGERRAQQFLMARPPPPPEHFTEMMALAEKLGNEILLEQCRLAKSKCNEALEFTRACSAPGSPARRRSYGTTDSANSWDDSLNKRTSWDDSDSGASYAGPMESIGSGSGGRPVLDNIAELRESAEQLLDCSPPRTPPRSPAPRRLVKPPVNSHLHRAPSIAPGMKAKKTILLIMREMIQTERDYVKSLEYIIENYIPELVREDIPQSLRGQRNVIFGNVEKIYEFHSQHFLRELEQCEQSPMMVGQCFLRHEKKFYLYALYNKNKPNSDSLMAEYGSNFFKAKQMELGDKMDLASYLLKPVQRMGKYALLLQQLVKAGTDVSDQIISGDKDEKDDSDEAKPIVEGEADLRAAEQMVRFQLRHGNDLLAMDSLRDCDVNVKEQGRLLRQNEFLVWQGKGKKCLRQVFLFEDLILFSKARRFPDRKNLDIYIYKHSIKTTDIGLTAVIADSPTKFEIWFRKRKPGDTYTLQCASEDIKKAWTEELSKLLWKQALRNREVRLAEMSSMGIGNKPCLDIRPSADQINDRSISVAQLSKTPRFRNSIAISLSDDSGRYSRRPHSVISVSSSSSSGGSSGPPNTLNLGLDASPRPHHRSTTLNSQCSVESGIIADISIVSDDGGDGTDRSHWNSTLESPTSQMPSSSTPLQSPISSTSTPVTSPSSPDANLTPYDQDMSINL